jgi:hypothetical protein
MLGHFRGMRGTHAGLISWLPFYPDEKAAAAEWPRTLTSKSPADQPGFSLEMLFVGDYV